MLKNTKYVILVSSLAFIIETYVFAGSDHKKIVGLIQVRNESIIIEQCLHALSLYTDAIVILDDASDDNTLDIIKSCADKYRIEKIICNQMCAWLNSLESYNRQKLLETGRKIGGTHFIIIDADEMFTATCLKGNFLRTKILEMQPGDKMSMHWIGLWKSIDQFRSEGLLNEIIFCDDGVCSYNCKPIHVPRIPENLRKGAMIYLEPYTIFGLLHFQAANWKNMELRRAWYHCFFKIRSPQMDALEINELCAPQGDDTRVKTQKCPSHWFDGYDFFDKTTYQKLEIWRKKQIIGWINQYGQSFFKDLNIWNIDWDENILVFQEPYCSQNQHSC